MIPNKTMQLQVSSGCALFGLADSIGTFAGARAIQGTGGAAILVAGMAIIMDCSLDVEADVARQVRGQGHRISLNLMYRY